MLVTKCFGDKYEIKPINFVTIIMNVSSGHKNSVIIIFFNSINHFHLMSVTLSLSHFCLQKILLPTLKSYLMNMFLMKKTQIKDFRDNIRDISMYT